MKLNYEEWYEQNEEEVYIELAENGADREMDFNSEREFEKRYEKYLSDPENQLIEAGVFN